MVAITSFLILWVCRDQCYGHHHCLASLYPTWHNKSTPNNKRTGPIPSWSGSHLTIHNYISSIAWPLCCLLHHTSQATEHYEQQIINNNNMNKINKNLYIFGDCGGVLFLFCLWIAVWYWLSWNWGTCAPSYCLSYFLLKIYTKNIIGALTESFYQTGLVLWNFLAWKKRIFGNEYLLTCADTKSTYFKYFTAYWLGIVRS